MAEFSRVHDKAKAGKYGKDPATILLLCYHVVNAEQARKDMAEALRLLPVFDMSTMGDG